MQQLKQQLAVLAEKINALSVRERVILLCMAVMAMGGAWYQFYLLPWQAAVAKSAEEITTIQGRIATLDAAQVAVLERSKEDPDKAERRLKEDLLKELKELQQRRDLAMKDMVPPDRMLPILEKLLARQKDLRPVALLTLKPDPVQSPKDKEVAKDKSDKKKKAEPAEKSTAAEEDDSDVIYRHTVQLELQGSYLALVHYLDALERLPMVIFWDTLSLSTLEFPTLKVGLQVYTLSLSREWLGRGSE
ncbi:MAG: hypothetical protein HQL82_10755 [Magnetococcales bacterium]|nr:hypothetical protein [Magnetococcales bacterium]